MGSRRRVLQSDVKIYGTLSARRIALQWSATAIRSGPTLNAARGAKKYGIGKGSRGTIGPQCCGGRGEASFVYSTARGGVVIN